MIKNPFGKPQPKGKVNNPVKYVGAKPKRPVKAGKGGKC